MRRFFGSFILTHVFTKDALFPDSSTSMGHKRNTVLHVNTNWNYSIRSHVITRTYPSIISLQHDFHNKISKVLDPRPNIEPPWNESETLAVQFLHQIQENRPPPPNVEELLKTISSFVLVLVLETNTSPFGVEIWWNTVFIVMPPDLGLAELL